MIIENKYPIPFQPLRGGMLVAPRFHWGGVSNQPLTVTLLLSSRRRDGDEVFAMKVLYFILLL
jgi:hypothetical protein